MFVFNNFYAGRVRSAKIFPKDIVMQIFSIFFTKLALVKYLSLNFLRWKFKKWKRFYAKFFDEYFVKVSPKLALVLSICL